MTPAAASTRRSVDVIDRRLIEILSDNSRLSVSELAARAGISRANAYQRIDRMQEDGAIRGFTLRTNPRRLGLDVAALIIVNGEQRTWRELLSEIQELPGVEYVALTAGGFDFVLIVRVPDVETLRDVVLDGLQGIPGIRSTQTMFILEEFDHRR